MLLLLLAGCDPSSGSVDQPAGGWQGTTEDEGTTLTVRTTGGSVWEGDGRLIEEIAIGTETRGEHDLLGQVYGIDATDDRIYILDRVFTTVRVYDMIGNHVMKVGRAGSGPGEFRAPTALGIDRRHGHLVVREASGVLHWFTLGGEYVLSRSPPGGRFWMIGTDVPLLRVTRNGMMIVPHFVYRPAPDTDLGYVSTYVLYAIDSSGSVADSTPLPQYRHDHFILTARGGPEGSYRPQPVPFGPQEVWSIGWDGSLITGHSAEYRFEVRHGGGRRTIIEREADPVQVHPEERQAAERRVYRIMRGIVPGWGWNGPEIPEVKPWYSAIIPDRSGRLWVLRSGQGRRVEGWTEPEGWREWERNPEWTEERWFEVFEEATGRYLGRVDVPAGFVAEPEPFIEGDTFIGLTEDADGRPVVRRYRLVLPSHPIPSRIE